MKTKLTSLFIISLLVVNFKSSAQTQDSISYKERYGITFGLDLSKIGRSFLEDNYTGAEAFIDYRYNDRIYIAAELGYDDKIYTEENLTSNTKGAYLKAGINYNSYENWIGMQNLIYAGFRFGAASFSHDLTDYTIYTRDTFFNPDIRTEERSFNSLTATWVELKAGIRVEVFKNIFLGANVQLKFQTSATELNNFDHLYIPGFNRTYDSSSIGAGWGYSISYMLPIYTKLKRQAIDN